MFIEEQELNDWKVNVNDNNKVRECKSISSYWLTEWQSEMNDITFKTVIYDDVNKIPDILPFGKCMTRYENKSPKDSEFFDSGISTKKELLNLYYTSLRCKTNPGKYYCVREWVEMGDEFRCFWNNKLVAISSESDNKPKINIILNYINSIKHRITFNKCVFDIAFLKDSEEMIFIEYNSWESNSGAHRFDWKHDTDIFYNEINDEITIRWNSNELKVNLNISNIITIIPKNYEKFVMNETLYEFIKPCKPSNWLITDKFIYISNDIWLGRFDYNLKPLNWTRGIFRFSGLELCTDGSIYCNDNFYYYDLTPKRTNSIICDNYFNENKYKYDYKYGIPLLNKGDDTVIFIRMLSDCELIVSNN